MPKLSKSFIDNEIKPVRSGQVIYRDDELTGFGLRVTRRTKTFIVERRVNGKNYRFSIGRYGLISVADARSKARTLLADMANGIAPDNSQSLPSMITLRQAYEKYIEVRPLAKQTRAHYKFLIEKCLVDWLDIPFMSITRDMVESGIGTCQLRQEGGAPTGMLGRTMLCRRLEQFSSSPLNAIRKMENLFSEITRSSG